MRFRSLLSILLVPAFSMSDALAGGPSYEALKKEAEAFYAEGSFAKSHALYEKARKMSLPGPDKRWVEFRWGDTLWRSESATRSDDRSREEEAVEALKALADAPRTSSRRDPLLADVDESLGDYHWLGASRRWYEAWPRYEKALDYWSGDENLDAARRRYLAIVKKISSPRGERYGDDHSLPTAVLDNALKIVTSDADKVHMHYLLARSLDNVDKIADHRRALREYETVLKAGKGNDWYDDALYHLAQWTENYGKAWEENGVWRFGSDYVKAVELFRRFVKEFKPGESRYHDSAVSNIKEITKPSFSIHVSNAFLPGSPARYILRWRNLKAVRLALYKVDMLGNPLEGQGDSGDWYRAFPLAGREAHKTWKQDTGDKGDHHSGQSELSIDGLPAGAYVLEAKGGEVSARELVLVTDAALVVKAVRRQVLVYLCDALSGAPLPDGRVKVWERRYQGSNYVWTSLEKATDKDGLAVFDLPKDGGTGEARVFGGLGDRQAFSTSYVGHHASDAEADYWRIYALTDRPVFRPGDTVQWKCLARRYVKDAYNTPAGASLHYEVSDPRGSKVKEGNLKLNAFGSAWDSLVLTEASPLGQYQVSFYDKKDGDQLGSAVLFRLEEYKLPEFKVSVKTPEENGRRKVFRLGETIEVDIRADYYFGGPVADASVDLVITPRPFRHRWSPFQDCRWYFDHGGESYDDDYGYSPFPIIHQSLKTDAAGRAAFQLPTSDMDDGVVFQIQARVTDKSRREIVADHSVKVMRQSYSVYVRSERKIHRPKTLAKISFKALDANDQPVEAEGVVTVTRDRWVEKGKDEKFYEKEDILTRKLRTDAAGEATLDFTPEKEGYYRVAWTSPDKDGTPITGETVLWAATTASREIGYRLGGFELILDKDTFRVGQTAPVMLVAPDAGRHVLFSLEGADLYSYRLIHMAGPVKMLEIPVEEKYVPNFFVKAALVKDAALYVDSKQVVVPPVEHFLTVDVAADKEEYRPREKGRFTLTAKDHEGKPVSAELSLSLVDESVFYIQEPYAGDPRQFFFGDKKGLSVQTQTSFFEIPYARFSRDKDQGFINELQQLREGDLVNKEIQGSAGGKGAMRMKSMPSPMASRPPEASADMAGGAAGDSSAVSAVSVVVRNDFRATALWLPEVATGPDGKAVVEAPYPDTLTSWRASAVALTADSRFGAAQTATRTKQPLIIRLQAPRFFLVGDKLTLSAVVNNNTNKDLKVMCDIVAAGLALEGGASSAVSVKAGGEARVDWPVSVKDPGEAKIRVTARAGDHGDAMEKTYPVHAHGMEKFIAKSGKMRGDQVTVNLDLPERKPDSTVFSVQATPSLAVGMLDALPYLIDYPYGCTEQTMSRFLPAAIVAKTLRDMGLSPADIEGKIFGGIEKEHAGATHHKGPASLNRLNDMVKQGLERLYDSQHEDGGWGWWKEGASDHYMSAYVVWGLSLAKAAGISVKDDVLGEGAAFLKNNIVKEEARLDNQAWMLHALTAAGGRGDYVQKAFKNLWTNRERLNAYSRALLAMSAKDLGLMEEARTLVRNLEDGVKRDEAPDTSILQKEPSASEDSVQGTAHWGALRSWWRWSEGGVESTAFALRALLAVDPKNALIEPASHWLIKNRRGSQWSNTRDSAMALLALNDYLKVSGESSANLEYEVMVNGRSLARQKVTPKEVLGAPSRFTVEPSQLKDGVNAVVIRRVSGQGPLYFSVQASFYSLEEPVKEAAHELFVRRDYFREKAKPTLLKGVQTEMTLLKDGDTVTSGDRIETVLTIETKNDYEYLLLEDLKPAGLEAVEVRSGESLFARQLKSRAVKRTFTQGETDRERKDLTGRREWVYQELRDRKVALFIGRLPEGVWEIRYTLRAEVPGKFHALPVSGHAMYVPEIRGNGDEIRLTVEDAAR